MSTINYIRVVRTSPHNQDPNFYCGCTPKPKIPGWLMDKMAEEKLSGGFKTSRKNLCTSCNMYKSSNGTCGCE